MTRPTRALLMDQERPDLWGRKVPGKRYDNGYLTFFFSQTMDPL